MSEILVGSIEEASAGIGLSPFFVSLIIVAIVGNAAEHWVAVYFASRDKVDLSVAIAVGSSAQIALFVMPVLVLTSFVHRPVPAGAGVQRAGDRGDPARGAHRRARDPGGRVDVVRGAAAPRRLRRPRRSSSSSSSTPRPRPGPARAPPLRRARPRPGPRARPSARGASRTPRPARRAGARRSPGRRRAGSTPRRRRRSSSSSSRSTLAESSTISTISVCGLKYVPGRVGARRVETAQGRHARQATHPARRAAARPRPRRPAAASRERPGGRCGPRRTRAPRRAASSSTAGGRARLGLDSARRGRPAGPCAPPTSGGSPLARVLGLGPGRTSSARRSVAASCPRASSTTAHDGGDDHHGDDHDRQRILHGVQFWSIRRWKSHATGVPLREC